MHTAAGGGQVSSDVGRREQALDSGDGRQGGQVAGAIVVVGTMLALTALAITGAWIVEYGDAHGGGYALASVAYLIGGAVVVVILALLGSYDARR
jgi:hypothetical protein